jgi:hypothetical protein
LLAAAAVRAPTSLVAQSRVPLVKRAEPTMVWNLAAGRQALLGASLAVSLATMAPSNAAASAAAAFNPPSVVLAVDAALDPNSDLELRPKQKQFLEDRAATPQDTQFEKQVEGTFKAKDATEKGKFKYSTVVVGLLLISFVAPMAQFFYYVKEEEE